MESAGALVESLSCGGKEKTHENMIYGILCGLIMHSMGMPKEEPWKGTVR